MAKSIHLKVDGNNVTVTGETYPVKETLKRYGFRWDRTEKVWYNNLENFEVAEILELRAELDAELEVTAFDSFPDFVRKAIADLEPKIRELEAAASGGEQQTEEGESDVSENDVADAAEIEQLKRELEQIAARLERGEMKLKDARKAARRAVRAVNERRAARKEKLLTAEDIDKIAPEALKLYGAF
ncbi:MAG: hypothetical protein JRD89_05070 [Deltaproteobacteria bacterium]|nr:hypothetical protein [Deltaproteobacteria bacterium]